MPAPAAGTKTDRHIQAFTQDFHAVVVGRNPQVDLGMRRLKSLKPRQQPAKGEGRVDADAEHLDVPLAVKPVERPANHIETVFQNRRKQPRLVRRHEALRGALEQDHAELILQPRDLVADGRLRHTQLNRRFRKAALPHGDFKDTQRIEGNIGTVHRITFPNIAPEDLSFEGGMQAAIEGTHDIN